MTDSLNKTQLILVGAGRTHLQVLRGLARQRTGQLQVTLVAPAPYYTEPRMLPDFITGDCSLEDICRPLDDLVEASGAQYVPAHVYALDPVARRIQLSTGDALPYDVLSVNSEPSLDRTNLDAHIPGARENALFLHPHNAFVQLWPQMMALAASEPLQVAVIADDLVGLELALAAAHAVALPHGSRVTLVAGRQGLMLGQPPALQRRLASELQRLRITVLYDECSAIERGRVHLSSGASLTCDAPLLALGAQPDWLLQSGLALEENGALQVNERLQSQSHRQIFVIPSHIPHEAGPTVESNLRAALGQGNLRKVSARPAHLRVVHGGNRQAIAAWGPWCLGGREVWNWKSRRDRRILDGLFQP